MFGSIENYGFKNAKIGLIMCHGHNHPVDIYTRLKFVNYWYMIDISDLSFPDYICDIDNNKQLEYFPDAIFDYILFANCPLYDNNFNLGIKKIDNSRRLLKDNGYMIITNFQFNYFLDEPTLDKINKNLIANNSNIVDCLNNYDRENSYGVLDILTKNNGIYWILSNACYPLDSEIIKQTRKKYSKKILKKYGYHYVKEIGPYSAGVFRFYYLFMKSVCL